MAVALGGKHSTQVVQGGLGYLQEGAFEVGKQALASRSEARLKACLI